MEMNKTRANNIFRKVVFPVSLESIISETVSVKPIFIAKFIKIPRK